MSSKIMDTLDKFLPRGSASSITGSNAYQSIRNDLRYFEQYVRSIDVPDLVGMINSTILEQARSIKNPQLSVIESKHKTSMLAISEQGNQYGPVVMVGPLGLLASIGIISGTYGEKHFSGPAIHINQVGYNKHDPSQYADKGVLVQGYKITQNSTQSILKGFSKLKGKRNDIILALAASEDLTNCTGTSSVDLTKRFIAESGTTKTGIDENQAYVLARQGPKISAFGNSNGYNHEPHLSIDMRVERTGVQFKVPSYQY